MVSFWTRLRNLSPILACLLVGLSLIFPGKASRDVVALRAEFDSCRANYDDLSRKFAEVVQFIHDYDFSSIVRSEIAAAGVAGLHRDTVAGGDLGLPSSDVHFMMAFGRPGISCRDCYWFVGDMTPWGRLESAFRGGFVADGSLYSFLPSGVRDD